MSERVRGKRLKKLPRIRCPKCFDHAYAYRMSFICDGCKSTYPIGTKDIHVDGVVDIDPKLVRPSDIPNKSDKDKSFSDNILLDISGDMFKPILTVKDKYGLKDVDTTIKILLLTMIDIVSMLETRKTSKISFIDSEGKMSKNLKNGHIFEDAKKKYLVNMENKNITDSFIEDMQRQFILSDVTKFYNSVGSGEKNMENIGGADGSSK